MEVINLILSILLIILVGGLITYFSNIIGVALPSYIMITFSIIFILVIIKFIIGRK